MTFLAALELRRLRLRAPFVLGSLLLLLTACGSPAPKAPAAPRQPSTPMPLGAEALQRVGKDRGLNMNGWVLEPGKSPFYLIYDSVAEDGSEGRPRLISSSDGGRSFTEPVEIELGTGTVQGAVSVVRFGGQTWLYFLETEGPTEPGGLFRARFEEGTFGHPEELTAPEGLRALVSWPKFSVLGDGRVAVAYRDLEKHAKVIFSEDGRTFADPMTVHGEDSAMPDLGIFRGGAMAYVYQTGAPDGLGKISWVRTSRDGQAWSGPRKARDGEENVHDSFLVRRLDGDLDIYYCYTNVRYTGGFSVFRRRLSPDGALGPEQRVTTREAGSFIKPTLNRLPDGGLLMTLTSVMQEAENEGMHLWITMFHGDSPVEEPAGFLQREVSSTDSLGIVNSTLSRLIVNGFALPQTRARRMKNEEGSTVATGFDRASPRKSVVGGFAAGAWRLSAGKNGQEHLVWNEL